MSPRAPVPKLYLVLHASEDNQKLIDLVKSCQNEGIIGAIMLECGQTKPPYPPSLHKTVATLKDLGITTLIAHDANLARTLKADGVHLCYARDNLKEFRKIRKGLGTKFLVGAEAGGTRHEAMCLGEEGADYVAFGKEMPAKENGGVCEQQRKLVAWWADLFEVPCVALDIETPLEARTMREAGSDFIAIKVPQEITFKTVAKFLDPYFEVFRP